MAVTAAHLTSGGNATNGASYDTASVTPSGNQLVLLWVSGSGTNSQTHPTVTGNGLTWVEVTSVSQSTLLNGYLFRAMAATPSTGAATIAWSGGNVTGCNWSMAEFDGVDTTGTNGSGAVVQSDVGSGTATSLTVTLDTAITAGNATAGGFAIGDDIDIVGGSGYAELGEGTHANPPTAIGSEWRADGNVTVDASWATSQAAWGIALEIKAAAGGISAAANPATETDTAVALSKSKSKAAAVVAETDAAVALGRIKTRLVAPAAETDTATAVGRVKAEALAAATETDSAQSITEPGAIVGAIAAALETDTAIAVGRRKTKALAPATETNTATLLGRIKARVVGVATELGSALGLSRSKRLDVGAAAETDTAVAITTPSGPDVDPIMITVASVGATATARSRTTATAGSTTTARQG